MTPHNKRTAQRLKSTDSFSQMVPEQFPESFNPQIPNPPKFIAQIPNFTPQIPNPTFFTMPQIPDPR